MQRYMIVRTFEIDEEAMPDVGRRSKEIAKEEFPEISWEHSHVIVGDHGSFRQFCVYTAPDLESVREAHQTAGLTVERMWSARAHHDAPSSETKALVS